eukprot:355473-Chlamydomonas_euryale.AAC.2
MDATPAAAAPAPSSPQHGARPRWRRESAAARPFARACVREELKLCSCSTLKAMDGGEHLPKGKLRAWLWALSG